MLQTAQLAVDSTKKNQEQEAEQCDFTDVKFSDILQIKDNLNVKILPKKKKRMMKKRSSKYESPLLKYQSFECEYCGNIYDDSNDLSLHVSRKHPEFLN